MSHLLVLRPPVIHQEEAPVIFLAGPVKGAYDWQMEAKDLIQQALLQEPDAPESVVICTPRGLPKTKKSKKKVWSPADQYNWETHYLLRASQTGVILFWLAYEDWHSCNRPFAQTTRLELGEWLFRSGFGSQSKLALGIDPDFSGKRYIQHRVITNPFQALPIFDTLEETCQQAVKLLIH